eukprot:171972-Alexandrium_andersonii.AAC.1
MRLWHAWQNSPVTEFGVQEVASPPRVPCNALKKTRCAPGVGGWSSRAVPRFPTQRSKSKGEGLQGAEVRPEVLWHTAGRADARHGAVAVAARLNLRAGVCHDGDLDPRVAPSSEKQLGGISDHNCDGMRIGRGFESPRRAPAKDQTTPNWLADHRLRTPYGRTQRRFHRLGTNLEGSLIPALLACESTEGLNHRAENRPNTTPQREGLLTTASEHPIGAQSCRASPDRKSTHLRAPNAHKADHRLCA